MCVCVGVGVGVGVGVCVCVGVGVVWATNISNSIRSEHKLPHIYRCHKDTVLTAWCQRRYPARTVVSVSGCFLLLFLFVCVCVC